MSSSLLADESPDIGRAVVRLDGWFETMRAPDGYTGPVSHWWESSLLSCGPMADWRYEGLISGYLALHGATGSVRWLDRAVRAADDLLAAQTPCGTFRSSAFQQGPMEGGTPHEAAADVGLLELASSLRRRGDDRWLAYFDSARRNIEGYLIGQLWTGHGFRDQPWSETLVANKNATIIEALVAFEALTGREMTPYLDGAADVIGHARETHGPRAGGTIHVGTGRHRLAIGIYTARSMCGLLQLHERDADDRWLDAVRASVEFLRGLITNDGVFFGRYPDGGLIASPRLVAASGDMLRLFWLARRHGLASPTDVTALTKVLLDAQTATGSIPTAIGFARRGSRTPHDGLPDLRDVLPVVGWCDKAFRALCLMVRPATLPGDVPVDSQVEVDCVWLGRPATFLEDAKRFQVVDRRSGRVVYHWWKGTCYPDTYLL